MSIEHVFFVSLTWGFYRFELNSTFDWERGAEFMRARNGDRAFFQLCIVLLAVRHLNLMMVSPPETPDDRFYPGGNSLSAIA